VFPGSTWEDRDLDTAGPPRPHGPGADYRGDTATPPHITNLAAHNALVACARAVVLVITALAVVRFTDPNWTLAGVAALFSAGTFLGGMLINTSVVQPRSVIAPPCCFTLRWRPSRGHGSGRARRAAGRSSAGFPPPDSPCCS
jgi:hypothetical protein